MFLKKYKSIYTEKLFMMEMAYIQKVDAFINSNKKQVSPDFSKHKGWEDIKNYLNKQVIAYYKQVKKITGNEPNMFEIIFELEAKFYTEVWNPLSDVEKQRIKEFTKFCDDNKHLFKI